MKNRQNGKNMTPKKKYLKKISAIYCGKGGCKKKDDN